VELLHSHTITQFHWSSGSTVCFLPRRAAVRVQGMHTHFWNWDSPVRDVSLQYIPTYLSFSLSLHLSSLVSASLFLSLSVYTYLSLSIFICLHRSVHLSFSLYLSINLYLSLTLSQSHIISLSPLPLYLFLLCNFLSVSLFSLSFYLLLSSFCHLFHLPLFLHSYISLYPF
jgi:hypothetical protein